MQLKAIVNYADSSPSINATVGLSIQENAYSDGKRAGFNPNSNNTINLGLAGKRWANVYATNYYYGSGNVEFSNKFVTTDTAQTISGNKTFSSINGVEPSSLSLPSGNANDVIDISSYITDLSGYPNDYIAPANGFITISATGTGLNMLIDGSPLGASLNRSTSGSIKHYIPILKNQKVRILVIASSLEYVKFIPCQGNV